MSIQLQLRRGNTAVNNIFTGAQGELTMDTGTNGLRIHDGTTQGGFSVPVLVSVQRPTAENNYTWWRKYSDGWVVIGGKSPHRSSAVNPVVVNLPLPMANEDYHVDTTVIIHHSQSPAGVSACVDTQTVSNFTVNVGFGTGGNAGEAFFWRVEGYAAAEEESEEI